MLFQPREPPHFSAFRALCSVMHNWWKSHCPGRRAASRTTGGSHIVPGIVQRHAQLVEVTLSRASCSVTRNWCKSHFPGRRAASRATGGSHIVPGSERRMNTFRCCVSAHWHGCLWCLFVSCCQWFSLNWRILLKCREICSARC